MNNKPNESYFDEFAKIYETNYGNEQTGKTYEFKTRQALAIGMVPLGVESILDCAVGTGQIINEVLTKAPTSSVTAVDISRNMLKITSESLSASKLERIQFCHTDIFEFFDTTTSRFDLVFCIGLLAHIGRLELLLCQINSAMKENATLIIQTSRAETIRHQFVRFVNKHLRPEKHWYQLAYYSETELIEALEANGFEVKSKRRFLIGIPFANKLAPKFNYYLEYALARVADFYGNETLIRAVKKHEASKITLTDIDF